MICPACQTENEPGRKFCGECGGRLAALCPSCGTPNAPGTKFCGECGATLSGADDSAAAAPAQTPTTAPGPAAERRLVSVLFADLVGFTSLAEDRDPEETRDLLNRYFETARDVIERYGGVVEKFIGDAVMAVWGTPVAHEDDAERATRAALELADAVAGVGTAAGAELTVRAAVLTGEAAVTIGATGQGMVAGDLVNSASRLQSMAPPGAVLVGEATYRAAEEAITFEPIGEQQLKGKHLPVAAWRALRVVGKLKGAGRAGALEPPFVGREEELRLLKEMLHATARERRPRLVSMTGAAGIGKSRLGWELLKYVDGVVEDIYWHEGRSPAYGEGVTFWALGEMVRQRAEIAETDDPAVSREKLSAAMAEYVTDETERGWIEPRLAGLLGLEEMPPGESEQLVAAWRTFFERIAERGTTVMVFEDLHWADGGVLDFIEHLLEWARTSPILVVTLARPELLDRRPTWGARQRAFTSIHLDPLEADDMRGLIDGMAPGIPDRLAERIAERAEGIPLYAVELVRMLLADGRLVPEGDRFRASGDVDTLEVPTSLHGLLAARLDALEAADRALLQTASILGQSFTEAALVAVSGADDRAVRAALDRLVRSELIGLDVDPRSPERGQYRFLQGLTREVASGMLARPERRARHVAAARYYEQLGDEELAGVLATHYLEAYRAASAGPEAEALAAQARLALRAAGERAAALHSHEQALAYQEQALSVATDDADRAILWERAAESAENISRAEAAIEYAKLARDAYAKIGDDEGVLRATWWWARTLIEDGRPAAGIEILEAVLAGRPDADDSSAFAPILAELARGYLLSASAAEGLPRAERALAAAERFDDVRSLIDALVTRGTMLGLVGRLREGIALLHAAAVMAADAGQVTPQIRALGNLGFLEARNDLHAALRATLNGMGVARRFGRPGHLAFLASGAVDIASTLGAWDEGRRIGDEVLAELTIEHGGGPLLSVLSVLDVLRGERERAVDLLARSEAETADVTDPQLLQGRLITRSYHALAAGDLEAACDLALEAAPLADSNAWFAALLGSRLAFWIADAKRQAHALESSADSREKGAYVQLQRDTVTAHQEALRGARSEAAARFRELIRRTRDMDLPYDRAMLLLELAALLGPDTAEGTSATAEGRDILQGMQAVALLGVLDERLPGLTRALAGAEPTPRAADAAEVTPRG
jgi:class 3 adenylate cyclase/tetratricopeptide (TPR) repeat protein